MHLSFFDIINKSNCNRFERLVLNSNMNNPNKYNFGNKVSYSKETIKAVEELVGEEVASFTNVADYLDWYRNIYGELALQMLLEELSSAVKKKDRKKLLLLLGQNKFSKTIESVEEEFVLEQKAFVPSFEKLEVTDIPQDIMAATPKDLKIAEIEKLDSVQIEAYVDQLLSDLKVDNVFVLSALADKLSNIENLNEDELLLDEAGYMSLDEMGKLVSSLKERLIGSKENVISDPLNNKVLDADNVRADLIKAVNSIDHETLNSRIEQLETAINQMSSSVPADAKVAISKAEFDTIVNNIGADTPNIQVDKVISEIHDHFNSVVQENSVSVANSTPSNSFDFAQSASSLDTPVIQRDSLSRSFSDPATQSVSTSVGSAPTYTAPVTQSATSNYVQSVTNSGASSYVAPTFQSLANSQSAPTVPNAAGQAQTFTQPLVQSQTTDSVSQITGAQQSTFQQPATAQMQSPEAPASAKVNNPLQIIEINNEPVPEPKEAPKLYEGNNDRDTITSGGFECPYGKGKCMGGCNECPFSPKGPANGPAEKIPDFGMAPSFTPVG